nr:zinc finger, CCHC-type [Ipomoea batatas]
MSDTLFDIYQYEESSKDLWDVLKEKYTSEDASSKKFLVSEFNEFIMVDNRSVMEQFHEIVRILGQIRHYGMNMDDSIAIASIIDKLPPSWNKLHRALMQRKEELTMEQLDSHLYVEEGIRQKESKKKSGGRLIGASGSTINFVDEGKPYKNGKGKGKAWVKCWVCNGPHFKKDCEVWKEKMQGISSGDHGQTDDSWWVDTGATRHVCKDMNLYKCVHHLYGIHIYVT